MICDRTAQIDIRKLAKYVDVIPDVFVFGEERIVTTWTRTNFGGLRQWFLCPSCDRRCAIIYRLGNGSLWCCRVCGGGKYLSEKMSPKDRKLRKALMFRYKLGQKNPTLFLPFPAKPHGMHATTYNRLRGNAIAREREILVGEWADLRGVSVQQAEADLI